MHLLRHSGHNAVLPPIAGSELGRSSGSGVQIAQLLSFASPISSRSTFSLSSYSKNNSLRFPFESERFCHHANPNLFTPPGIPAVPGMSLRRKFREMPKFEFVRCCFVRGQWEFFPAFFTSHGAFGYLDICKLQSCECEIAFPLG